MKRALLLSLCLLLGLAFLGWRRFCAWEKTRLLESATLHYHRGEYRNAALVARQLLNREPASLPAHRLLAQVCKDLDSWEALQWQQKLIALEPENSSARLDLVRTATGLGEFFLAESGMEQIPVQERQSVAYHEAAMGLAIATQQYSVADWHLQEALKIQPDNRLLALNLATLQLVAANPGIVAAARERLQAFQSDPALGQLALRALLNDARKRRDRIGALALAGRLVASPRCELKDRLAYLEELQTSDPADFQRHLRLEKAQCSKEPKTIPPLMMWMNHHGLAAETIQWGGGLPQSAVSESWVALSIAEAYAGLDRWADLRSLLLAQKEGWGRLEFLRHAIQALVEVNGQGGSPQSSSSSVKWDRAIAATEGDPMALAMLARLAAGWGWKEQSAQVWWYIARRSSGQQPALKALYRLYSREKNTGELDRVVRRILEIEPENPVAKNNLAMLALLVGRDLAQGHLLAKEVYSSHVTNPAMASTYALSLHLQGRNREALEVLAPLPEQFLRQPSVAACFGTVLMAQGQKEKAALYLKIARDHREELFPEEYRMVEEAGGEGP